MRRLAEEEISKVQKDIVGAFKTLDPNATSFKLRRDFWLWNKTATKCRVCL